MCIRDRFIITFILLAPESPHYDSNERRPFILMKVFGYQALSITRHTGVRFILFCQCAELFGVYQSRMHRTKVVRYKVFSIGTQPVQHVRKIAGVRFVLRMRSFFYIPTLNSSVHAWNESHFSAPIAN